MGISSIVGQVMVVFTMIGLLALVIVTYRSSVLESNLILELQEQRIRQRLDTNIQIMNATYNATLMQTLIYAKNTGATSLLPDELELYLDNQRIPRSPSNRTFTLQQDNIINPLHWDQKETLAIVLFGQLSPGYHYLELVTPYGIKSAEIIFVSS
ncbi:MAG: hypothetical protein QW594_02265 [Candidatus Woesearchaeota archaeon]